MSYRSSYMDPVPMPYDKRGKSAQIYGIIALIASITCCPIVGLVLGIIALTSASASRRLLGFESAQATSGKILGIVAIVLSVLGLLLVIAYAALIVIAVYSELGASGGVVI